MSDSTLLLRKHINQFTPLNDADWSLFEPCLEPRLIKKNEFFIREGDMGRELGYVISGSMRHFYTYNGEEKTTYFYFENTLVGPYFSCITLKPSQLSIQALSDTQMLVFPYTVLKKLFEQNLAWAKFGMALAQYLSLGLEERMVGLLMLSPEERYVQLLGSNRKKILERIPQHYVANYLGITPVSLSRIRSRLMEKV
jgi:CRP-like cAMP-binding protein